MKKIDCFGDFCPLPLLKAQKEMELLSQGESFMLVTDHSCVVESIRDSSNNTNNYILAIDEVINGVWEITFTKTSN